jgi:hypothetical protein
MLSAFVPFGAEAFLFFQLKFPGYPAYLEDGSSSTRKESEGHGKSSGKKTETGRQADHQDF